MSKIISVTSLRNGVGRSAVSCLLANALSEQDFKVLVIDNNFKYCDISNYLMIKPDYTIDDLRPFLRSNVLEKETITSMAITAEKDVDVLCGSQMNFVDNTLTAEDIKKVKILLDDIYDYIIIDGKSGIENEEVLNLSSVVEFNIVVVRPNNSNIGHFERIKGTLEEDRIEKLEEMISKSFLVYNGLIESTSYDVEEGKRLFGGEKVFKLNYDENIFNYLNGMNVNMSQSNKEMIGKLIMTINGKEQKKKSLFGKNVKKIKSVFNLT